MDRRTKSKLVSAAADGDTAAFSELYGEIYKQLYYYALANLGSSEDAADAVQDAVLDAFSSVSGLRKPDAFDSWMFSILSAKIKKKQKEYAERCFPLDDINESSAVIRESGGFGSCEILEEFSRLTDQERLCITLSSIAGYRASEISQITGIKASAVRSCISRGRSKMRKKLELRRREVTE